MAFTLKDLDPEARAFLAYALLGRKERGAASAEKLRLRAKTPKLPVAEEKSLEALLVRITRRINATIKAGIRGDLKRAKARASRADADLEDLFREATFQDISIRLSRIVRDPEIAGLLDQFGARLNATNGREIERVIGVNPVDIDPSITSALLQFRAASVDLITSIAEDQLAQVRDLVNVAANTGVRVETLAAQIQERHNVSESRARLIARDQTLKTNGALTRLRHERIGVTAYTWDTSGDSRVRPDHRALDGTRHRWDDPPVTNPEGDRNHPGEDYQCRCIAIPILDEDAEAAASDQGQVGAAPSGAINTPDRLPEIPEVPSVEDLMESLRGVKTIGAKNGLFGDALEAQAKTFQRRIRKNLERGKTQKLVAEAKAQYEAARERGRASGATVEDLVTPNPSRDVTPFHRTLAQARTPEDLDRIVTGRVVPSGWWEPVRPVEIVVSDVAGNDPYIDDGNHRLQAAAEAGATEIRAYLITQRPDGTKEKELVILPFRTRRRRRGR